MSWNRMKMSYFGIKLPTMVINLPIRIKFMIIMCIIVFVCPTVFGMSHYNYTKQN